MDAPEDLTVHGAAEVVHSQDWALETDTQIISITARPRIPVNLMQTPAVFECVVAFRQVLSPYKVTEYSIPAGSEVSTLAQS